MKILVCALSVLAVLACSDTGASPTPNVDATVQAAIAEVQSTVIVPTSTPNVVATVEAAVAKALKETPTETLLPTATAIPTMTPAPTAKYTPTATPFPEPTTAPMATASPIPTPMQTPTPQPTVMAVPTRAPTATPVPTATSEPTLTPTPTHTVQVLAPWSIEHRLEVDTTLTDGVQAVYLQSLPHSDDFDLYLICAESPVGPQRFLYLWSWEPWVTPIDIIIFGLFDAYTGVYVHEDRDLYFRMEERAGSLLRSPVLTNEDVMGFLSDRQIDQIVDVIQFSESLSNTTVTIQIDSWEAGESRFAEFHSDNFDSVLEYATCFKR